MKKNGFLEGAMIATIGIVLCKILGIIYVIPFKSVIGIQGGALYGYAYSIYAAFLSLSTSGIPIAISKIVSEYNSLEYYNTKERAFKIGRRIIISIGFISFLVLLIFAPQFADLIMGNNVGGNSKENIALVIRIVSIAVLVVPVLSVSNGYLQGHKMMVVPSITKIIEQLVRVSIIIAISFLAKYYFDIKTETVVSISILAAAIGAAIAYGYIHKKIKDNRHLLNHKSLVKREEKKITNKQIAKKIVLYALPFILIDLIKSIFNMADTLTILKTLVNLGFSVGDAENILSVVTTWGSKLSMIVVSIAIGITTSLIPNIASSFIKNDLKDVENKVNKSIQALLFVVLPMTIGLSYLSVPVWQFFYGYDAVSIPVFKVFIYVSLTYSFYSVLLNTIQVMNNTKYTIITILVASLAKWVLNIPMMHLFDSIGIDAYIGAIATTIIIHIIASLILAQILNRKYQINYKSSLQKLPDIILANLAMILALTILKLFIPLYTKTKLMSLIVISIYSLVGIIVYLTISFKTKLIYDIFGTEFINKILQKFKIKKRT